MVGVGKCRIGKALSHMTNFITVTRRAKKKAPRKAPFFGGNVTRCVYSAEPLAVGILSTAVKMD